MSQSNEDNLEATNAPVLARLWQRRWQILVVLLLLFVGLPALLVLNNNVSFSGKSRSEIRAEMDYAFDPRLVMQYLFGDLWRGGPERAGLQ